MDLSNVIKKASTLFLHKPQSKSLDLWTGDEIIFSKNNVCIHSIIRSDHDIVHNPGYLTLSYKYKKSKKKLDNFTLQLTWIPNSVLQNNKNIQITKGNALILRRAHSSNELKYSDENESTFYGQNFKYNANAAHVGLCSVSSNSSTCSEECILFDTKDLENEFSKTENKNENINNSNEYNKEEICLYNNENLSTKTVHSESNTNDTDTENRTSTESVPHNFTDNSTIADPVNNKAEYTIFDRKRKLISHFRISFCEEEDRDETITNYDEHEYPTENTDDASYRKFSIDLSDMKSIRIFFSENDQRNGQLVIASKENQYKILHFHYGGLEKLLDALQQWGSSICTPFFIQNEEIEIDLSYKHFIIQKPLRNKSKSIFEQRFKPVTRSMWNSMLNELGQIEDEIAFRKAVFLGGLDKNIRKIVWPFLLNCYSCDSTFEERSILKSIHEQKYALIDKIKNDLLETTEDNILKNIEYLVYKDVIRTDRANSFYKGENNPNIKTMQNILLNYAVLYNDYGYSQGMSDLVAPILAEFQNEPETFWCFVSLMKRCLFVCTPTDSDMEKNLKYLRELIRVMHPTFYSYLGRQPNGMDLLFCHRWLLLCFKREFPLDIALHIWEACWSNYLTDYFHLFVTIAIIDIYSEDVMNNNFNSDEMLYHFSTLAMRMNGRIITQKARDLLYSFRSLPEIPSTLSSLCRPHDHNIWDSTRTFSSEHE